MSLLLADIDATCTSLGYHDGEKYYIERDTVAGLKVTFDLSEDRHVFSCRVPLFLIS